MTREHIHRAHEQRKHELRAGPLPTAAEMEALAFGTAHQHQAWQFYRDLPLPLLRLTTSSLTILLSFVICRLH